MQKKRIRRGIQRNNALSKRSNYKIDIYLAFKLKSITATCLFPLLSLFIFSLFLSLSLILTVHVSLIFYFAGFIQFNPLSLSNLIPCPCGHIMHWFLHEQAPVLIDAVKLNNATKCPFCSVSHAYYTGNCSRTLYIVHSALYAWTLMLQPLIAYASADLHSCIHLSFAYKLYRYSSTQCICIPST